MMYRTFLELGVYPAFAVVKVDDTGVGIAEGLAAGSWTVGVTVTGNEFGLNLAETATLPPSEFAARQERAQSKLTAAGAHYLVDSVAELMPVLFTIEGRLARDERP